MKKGFTLIELLAVIVILAIIALIATPIVLSIISDSKDSAGLRSAEMYLKGVETSIATATLNQKTISNGLYSIMSDGNICLGIIINDTCSKKDILKIEMNRETPISGSITIESGKVTDIVFTYANGKTIVNNNSGKLVYSGSTSVKEKTLDEVCKYQNNVVAEKTAGAKYVCEVKPGTNYNFYVLTTPEEGSKTINLIMDRNICEDGTPATAENTCLVAYNSSGDAKDVGPVTAMTYLNKATSTWKNINNLNITYDDEGKNFTGFVLNGKARLPYESEVASSNGSNNYLYENLNGGSWYGTGDAPANNISGINGYWTFSSYNVNSIFSWIVYYYGNVDFSEVVRSNSRGVRPVITLKI